MNKGLLQNYAVGISLWDPFPRPEPLHKEEIGETILQLLSFFLAEVKTGQTPKELAAHPRLLLRALLNIRPPGPIPEAMLLTLDRLLWSERVEAGRVDARSIPSIRQQTGSPHAQGDRLALWRGDLLRLEVDAIVNAANSALLGCFSPLHDCIDNVIHSAAGPRLREDCARIMIRQGHEEGTGQAKITRAYNLPSRFILHTVGPMVHGELRDGHRDFLASSYTACLDLAAASGRIKSLAFCCISTGVFGFPGAEAAAIAVSRVTEWLRRHPGQMEKVIFNVFTEKDDEHYRNLLS